MIDNDKIIAAEKCLIDNGIEPDEASTVLQTIGYILLDMELYPDDPTVEFVVQCYCKDASGKIGWYDLKQFKTAKEAENHIYNLVHSQSYLNCDLRISRRENKVES